MRNSTDIITLLDHLDEFIADELEDQDLDFKEWKGSLDHMVKLVTEMAVCMANGGGGTVVFGVADKVRGRAAAVRGVPPEVDINRLKKSVYDTTDPKLTPVFEEISVPEGSGRLVAMQIFGRRACMKNKCTRMEAVQFRVQFGSLIAPIIARRRSREQLHMAIRITPDEVTILSFPGPDRSINMDDLRAGRAVARRYRNRRIGEFLKELDLTEGRSTGIPKILEAMANNGSKLPVFETDPDRTSFLVRLPVREAPEEDEAASITAPCRDW